MKIDIHQHYNKILDQSHHQPLIVEGEHTGHQGRPWIHIDKESLQWAYTMQSTLAIAQYLGVAQATVQSALLEYGIANE